MMLVRLAYTGLIFTLSALLTMITLMIFDLISNTFLSVSLAVYAIIVYLVILYYILKSFEKYIKDRY